MSEDSAGDAAAAPEELSPCIGSVQNGQCFCTFVVTHFSTFAVAETKSVSSVVASSPKVTPSVSVANWPCLTLTIFMFALVALV